MGRGHGGQAEGDRGGRGHQEGDRGAGGSRWFLGTHNVMMMPVVVVAMKAMVMETRV